MHNDFKPIALSTTLAAFLSGCAVPGGTGMEVGPIEGPLVQQLISENCIVYSSDGKSVPKPDEVTIKSLRDGSFEGERIAYISVKNANTNFIFRYIRHAALLKCGNTDYGPSQSLVDMGGDPYSRIEHKRFGQVNPFDYKDIYGLSIQWAQFDEMLSSSIRMIGNTSGTIVVHLPDGQGTCLGNVHFPPKISYGLTWDLRCPMTGKGGSGPTHSQTITTGVVGLSSSAAHQFRFVVGELQ